jgi:hypothetical protein
LNKSAILSGEIKLKNIIKKIYAEIHVRSLYRSMLKSFNKVLRGDISLKQWEDKYKNK